MASFLKKIYLCFFFISF